MSDMPLQEAIAEVKHSGKEWTPWDFTQASKKNPLHHASATILNAAASGDLIPKADAELISLPAKVEAADRLAEVLQPVRAQKTVDEMLDEIDRDDADFEYAYDECVKVVRAALSAYEGEK